MTQLLPYIPFAPRETLLSYAGRLAAIHTGQGLTRLLADMRINSEHFILGRDDAVAQFAEVVDVDLALLQRSNMRAMGPDVMFREERVQKTFLVRAADKYCPVCLAEDGSHRGWKQRLNWCFAPVYRCPDHGVSLNRLSTPARTLQEAEGRLDGQPNEVGAPTPAYLDWLEARLWGDPATGAWLDEQSIQQVLDACLMLGSTLVHGHRQPAKKLSPLKQEAAIQVGFDHFVHGPEGVIKALDEIRDNSPARAVQAGPLAHYGLLFDWLDRRSKGYEPGPIRDILRDHIIEHDAVDIGTKVLGVEVRKRRYHSVQSLAETVGINRTRMSRLLQKLNRVPLGATDAESGLLRFEADEIATLVSDFETAVPLSDVPDYIGASLTQMQALYAADLLLPLVPRNSRGAVRNVVFAKRHLDTFLVPFEALPKVDQSQVEGLHSIAYACQRGGGTTAEVVKAIVDGDLSAFRLPDKSGLAAIVLSPLEAIARRAI